MNLKDNGWRFLVLGAVVIGLIWWRQQGLVNQDEDILAEQLALEQQVNEFLEERGIELPEGSDRANLRSVAGELGTGVATRVEGGEQTEFTVVAALQELEAGWYEAWLRADGEVLSMGRMRSAKGGFVVDYSTGVDASSYSNVVVSRQDSSTSEPMEIVLEGEFM